MSILVAGLFRVKQGSSLFFQRNNVLIEISNRSLVWSNVRLYFSLTANTFCRNLRGYVIHDIMTLYVNLAISLYDATLAHQISCSEKFSKLIISIPRLILRDRIAGIENCTALRIPGNSGVGAVTANFIRSTLSQTNQLTSREFSRLSEYSLDLLTLALATVRPEKFNLSKSRSLTLNRIKVYIEEHLSDSDLYPTLVANEVGLSPRYINTLFKEEETSLIRYISQRRLENCRKDLLDPIHVGARISDIAFRWGFNDLSHFSRVFKQRYDYSPKDYRQKMVFKDNNEI